MKARGMFEMTRVAVFLIAVLLVVGCATTDEQRTKTEGTAAGAVIGGLLGYVIDGQRGALIGAAIGAGAGYAVGNEIAKRKQAYASTEDFLDAEITRVDEFNHIASAYNSRARQDLVRLEEESLALRRQFDSGAVNKAALESKRSELQTRIASSQELEKTLTEELEIQVVILEREKPGRAADDPYIVRLEAEVRALEGHLETLREGGSQLARIDQRLSV